MRSEQDPLFPGEVECVVGLQTPKGRLTLAGQTALGLGLRKAK